ncbi:DUF6221 family protein [Streptosporangium sandarakinum]
MTEDMLSWLRQQIESDKATAEAAANAPREIEYIYPDGPREDGRRWEHREAPDGGHWTYTPGEDRVVSACGGDGVAGAACSCCVRESEGREVDLIHIALHDPRDTIARCEAELYILDCHEGSHECASPDDNCLWIEMGACPTVRAMAWARRHRPGYKPEWAIEGATP